MVKPKEQRLNIFLNGSHLGELKKTSAGALSFLYTSSWVESPNARPISLSLPLSPKAYTGDVVFNFFDNLLPDNPKIRSRIQSKFHILTNHPFDLLKIIGRDCIGAIQLAEGSPVFSQSIEGTALTVSELSQLLKGYQDNPLGMSAHYDDFRISIAGAQEKAAFLYHKKKWHIPAGSTPTTHIFKLPIGMIPHQQIDLGDSCENEWLCLKIAEAFGFKVPNSFIEHIEDVKVLVVERFDRKLSLDQKWIVRLPQEDMCQALGFASSLKYQSDGGPGIKEIMKLLTGAQSAALSRDTFFRSQILFWLLCAIDGHAKNFSLFLEPGSRYSLTPLYDIISAFPLLSGKQLHERKLKMAMALKGKNTHYTWFEGRRSHFLSTAEHCGYSVSNAEKILDEMLAKVDIVIEEVSRVLPTTFPDRVSTPIFEGMQKMKNRLVIR